MDGKKEVFFYKFTPILDTYILVKIIVFFLINLVNFKYYADKIIIIDFILESMLNQFLIK